MNAIGTDAPHDFALSSPNSVMQSEHLLLERLSDVERVTTILCRTNGLRGADAEDFDSFVKLKLIENDCAILRKFKGHSQFTTYISVVVHRFLLDYRNRLLGKWRPSAAARRLGVAAVALERLLHRDRRTLDEAIGELTRTGVERSTIEHLATQLRQRTPRHRLVDLDAAGPALTVPSDVVEDAASTTDRHQNATTTSVVMREAIAALDADDHRLFRLHFEAGMTIAEIARSLRIEQKPIYRRRQRILADIRKRLEAAGIRETDAEDLIRTKACDLDFGLVTRNAPAGPSMIENEADTGDGEGDR